MCNVGDMEVINMHLRLLQYKESQKSYNNNLNEPNLVLLRSLKKPSQWPWNHGKHVKNMCIFREIMVKIIEV